MLLLATSNAITQWSAVVPFLWIIPLGLYLLSFVVVFADQRVYDRVLFGIAFLLLAGTSLLQSGLQASPSSSGGLVIQLALQAATLFTGCTICHAELAELRPTPARLPKFYLAIAVGGALGGGLVVLLAPMLFSDYFEHPAVLLAISAIATTQALDAARKRVSAVTKIAVSAAGLFFVGGFAAGIGDEWTSKRDFVERVRNFYGVVRIYREDQQEPQQSHLVMQQAGVDQGVQFQAPQRKMELVCGFNAASGVGLALAHQAKRRQGAAETPLHIGVIGLGAGMIAALGHEGDIIRYYELNPAVLAMANRHFTFLREGRARTHVELGDARLVLERQLRANGAQQFDVLVLNAFRGAAPPMHLMTKEAFALYRAHLAENGILTVDFEVETFELAPLHRGMATELEMLVVRWFETKQGDNCEGAISWALYTMDKGFFETPAVRSAISNWRDKSKRGDRLD